MEHGEAKRGDLEPSGELRGDEELEGGAENFGLSKSCGFPKAFPNLGQGSLESAIKSDTCRWRYDEVTRPGERRRGTGKPRENIPGSDPDSPLPAPASCFRRESGGVAGVSALALGVSAGLVGGGISAEKAAGWESRASRALRGGQPPAVSVARTRGLAGRRRPPGDSCSHRATRSSRGPQTPVRCIAENRRDARAQRQDSGPQAKSGSSKPAGNPSLGIKLQAGGTRPRWGARGALHSLESQHPG